MHRKSLLIAGLLLAGLVLWVASGHIFRAGSTAAVEPEATISQAPRFAVEVQQLQAQPITRTLVNQGQTESFRQVTLRAETAGTVEAVLVPKGSRVEAGQPILRLRMDDRDVRLAEARANLAQRQAEFNATRDLARDGFQSANAQRLAEAALEKARAELKSIELDRDRVVIRAPFAGVLNDRMVELGDYVAVNTPVAFLVDNNPLLVSANIAQHDLDGLALDGAAEVRLVSGEIRQGTIRFISAAADTATRTFRVEVELPNSDSPVPAGISAEVRIPVGVVSAHRVSPALLALDGGNALGVKTVDAEDQVVFHPVEVIRAEQDGVWVAGLPEHARVITLGQGFVSPGQHVAVRQQAGPADQAKQ
ncbi:MAG: efflux RND transporter periplasmic adaptor subunit [Ectothiorhodospiraceae bacterium]|nr:efflux RND transporter periplasmic adaptor subunit [Ectothiorhodospiraceae bacterium]MCH8504075.1 efflux RND transporter periplasmic adaptor subunit [Ectothiorhodospiraceae bacterium]